MGLALDELEEKKDISYIESDINIVYDQKVNNYLSTLQKVTVDFIESGRGGGFILDTGIECGGC